MIESNSIGNSQAAPLKTGETRQTASPPVQTKPEGHVKLSPSHLAPEPLVTISDEAKTKMNDEADMLKFLRKVQAQADDQQNRPRVDALKAQLATPEGKSAYLARLNLEQISQNIVSQNQLT
jgi:hypothetical protein